MSTPREKTWLPASGRQNQLRKWQYPSQTYIRTSPERIADVLEKHYKDMQDMEFTVERNKLYMLQTRAAKRTAVSAVKIAVDMVGEDLISKKPRFPALIQTRLISCSILTSMKRRKQRQKSWPRDFLHHRERPLAEFTLQPLTQKRRCQRREGNFVRQETSPEDLAGMVAAEGILTARGGMTSHAAVVARGMGKCCVAGCRKSQSARAKRL